MEGPLSEEDNTEVRLSERIQGTAASLKYSLRILDTSQIEVSSAYDPRSTERESKDSCSSISDNEMLGILGISPGGSELGIGERYEESLRTGDGPGVRPPGRIKIGIDIAAS